MTKLLPLHHCQTKDDALYLKNRIQQTISVPVYVQRKENGCMLVVSQNSYKKAKVIVDDQLSILPSALAFKAVKNVKSSLEVQKTESSTPRFENLFLDLFSQLRMM